MEVVTPTLNMNKYYNFIIILLSITIISLSSVTADIVSINSFGDSQGVVIPEKNVEGFFFLKQVPIVIPPSSGGGTGSMVTLSNITIPKNITTPINITIPINKTGFFNSPLVKKLGYFTYIIMGLIIIVVILFAADMARKRKHKNIS